MSLLITINKTKATKIFVYMKNNFFSNYKASKEKQKEFYFLSVFLGDFLASPKFCNQLVKRGRNCTD